MRPRECQKPSIHGLRWPKPTKTITGKKISITGKIRKITGKKYSFCQIRGESRNDARSALGKRAAAAEAKAPPKSAKKPRKAAAGQREMLMPIAGKKAAKETAAKKPAG